MANILVELITPAANTAGTKCLRVSDLDTQDFKNAIENGTALRKVIRSDIGETVNWLALASDPALSISFPGLAGANPFQGPLPKTMSANGKFQIISSGPLSNMNFTTGSRFKYTIAFGAGQSLVSEDPQIIIDTGSIGTNLKRKPRKTKKAGRKKS